MTTYNLPDFDISEAISLQQTLERLYSLKAGLNKAGGKPETIIVGGEIWLQLLTFAVDLSSKLSASARLRKATRHCSEPLYFKGVLIECDRYAPPDFIYVKPKHSPLGPLKIDKGEGIEL